MFRIEHAAIDRDALLELADGIGQFRMLSGAGHELAQGHESVQRIMLSHAGHQRPAEIDAHLPDHARFRLILGLIHECPGRRDGEFAGPAVIAGVVRRPRNLIEGVHPAGQIVEILPVTIPFPAFVIGFVRSPFRERLADPQATGRGMTLAIVLVQPADPALARIVVGKAPQHVMDLVHQLQGKVSVAFLAGQARHFEEIADGEGVGPEIASRGTAGNQAGPAGEGLHQVDGLLQTAVH